MTTTAIDLDEGTFTDHVGDLLARDLALHVGGYPGARHDMALVSLQDAPSGHRAGAHRRGRAEHRGR